MSGVERSTPLLLFFGGIFNSNLTNLMYCIKKRSFLLIRELGFLPLNARDEFSVLLKFFQKEPFTDEYLEENLELAKRYLTPPEYEQIRELMFSALIPNMRMRNCAAILMAASLTL